MAEWHCGAYTLRLDERPLIMGILNVTPDSFSDGYPSVDQAMDHAQNLIKTGADIIDVGGESTRPGSQGISIDDELNRVIPVIERLAGSCDLPISIDTQKPEVARRAIEAGAAIVNHVSATLDFHTMMEVLADTKAGYVAMHMKARPDVMQEQAVYDNLLIEIIDHLKRVETGLKQAGVEKERLIFDPGIGFGKKLAHNLEILRSMRHLRRHLGRPLLMGLSRKSWFTHLLGVPRDDVTELDSCTALTSALLPFPDVAVHRVHNVRGLHNAFKLKDELEDV